MAERRELHNLTINDHMIGCPLCMAVPPTKVELARQAVEDAERALKAAEAEEAAEAVEADVDVSAGP